MAETVTISKAEYESMKETLEILSDKRAVEAVKKSLIDLKKGKFTRLDLN